MHHLDSQATISPAQKLLAEDLRKSYGPRLALRGLSFSLHAGRVMGFLGPNGAGKTTAIRILTTILEPTSGNFVVDGIKSDRPEEIRRRIGVLPESLGFSKQITGLECLTYFGQLYGRTAAQARAKGLALLEEVGLEQRAKSLIGSYSRGMRQRLGIARALVNDPAVVFLDEPTLGLDPRGQQELLGIVRWIAKQRSAGVILCSHLLSEVEGVCDDVVILNSGQIVATGTVGEVVGRAQRAGVQGSAVRVRVPAAALAEARRVLESLANVTQATLVSEHSGWLRVELVNQVEEVAARDGHVQNSVLEAMIQAQIPILGFDAEGNRLHDAFLHLTEGGIE